MSTILYKTFLYKSGANVIGRDISGDPALIDEAEIEHGGICQSVDAVTSEQNTSVIMLTYSDFHALVIPPFTWSDVKRIEFDDHIEFYLIVERAANILIDSPIKKWHISIDDDGVLATQEIV